MTFNWRPAVSGPGVASAIDDWRERAACRDEEPELFYAVGNSGPAILQTAQAKDVCRRCPVVLACLMDALRYPAHDQHGVQGGLSAEERKRFTYPCWRGHARVVENLAVAHGQPYCVPCRRADVAAFFATQRVPLAAELQAVAL